MKIVCSKTELVKGVNIVQKAVPTRTTMAILECILIDASGDEILRYNKYVKPTIAKTINGRA